MRTFRFLAVAALLTTSAAAQPVIPVSQFRSVELHHGGRVILRHGPVQRVTMLSGDPQYTRVRVADGQRLIIDNDGKGCPRGYRLEVEIVTPAVAAVSVANGGSLQSVGVFPPQAAISARVDQGGRIDIRSIAADSVVASVDSGGGIFTDAREALSATITSGGAITYWGDARVDKTVRRGGVVQRGRREDADRPLQELSRQLPPIPPLPPLPPLPPGSSNR